MEVDDEVAYEFDLHISTSKCDLFSFSTKDYPFHESTNTSIESIKLKPKAKQFEIDLNFNDSNSFSKRKNNELLICDDDDEVEEIINDKLMKSKVLKSNYLQETKIKYGVCYLNKTKNH